MFIPSNSYGNTICIYFRSPYINICCLQPRLARYAQWNQKSYIFSETPTQGGGSAKKRIQLSAICPENKAFLCEAVAWTKMLCVVAVSQVFVCLWKKLVVIKIEQESFWVFLCVVVSHNFAILSNIVIFLLSKAYTSHYNPGYPGHFPLVLEIFAPVSFKFQGLQNGTSSVLFLYD